MASAPINPSRSLLAAKLAPLHRRLQFQRVAVAAFWATAVTIGALTLRQLAAFWFDPVPALVTLALLWPASLAAALLLTRRKHNDLHLTARIAETRLGLQERLSTALETAEDSSAVAAALHLDALRFATTIEVGRAAPWRWPRRALFVAVGGCAAFALLAVWPTQLDVRLAATGDQPPGGQTIGAETMFSLAEAVQADADRRGDPYLTAVADSLRELAEAIERGEQPVEFGASLESTLEHLARAYDSNLSGRALAERLLANDAGPSTGPGFLEAREGTEYEDLERGPSAGDLERLLASLEGAEERPFQGLDMGAEGQAQPQSVTGYLNPELIEEMRARQVEAAGVPPQGAGDLIGAANEATAGESQLAGRGSQALAVEGADYDAHIFESADQVTVAGRERDDGRRIEIHLPTTAGDGAQDLGPLAVGAWTSGPEASLEHDAVAAWYRAVAGRYFLPSQQLRGATR